MEARDNQFGTLMSAQSECVEIKVDARYAILQVLKYSLAWVFLKELFVKQYADLLFEFDDNEILVFG